MSNGDNGSQEFDLLMKKMAAGHQAELPSPGLIWWRAQIQRKLAARERVERPMRIMRAISLAVVCVIFAAIVAANWREMGQTGMLVAVVLVAVLFLFNAASIVRELARKS